MKHALFAAAAVLGTSLLLVGAVWLVREALFERLQPQLLSLVAASLSEEERQALASEAALHVDDFWDSVPEPRVGRLARAGAELPSRGVEVRINRAGLRSAREFGPRPDGVFRIVCLGDSFVFGVGAPEEDRFCDQLEAFYAEHGVRPGGRRVESYALGLGSWTAVQSASYLAARISDYAPDVVLVLTVANDVTAASGVTGSGRLTRAFAPDERRYGSGVFTNMAGAAFGSPGWSAITTDLSPEAQRYWRDAMSSLRRLSRLQQQRGGHILHSLLDYSGPYFVEAYKRFYHEAGIEAPAIVSRFPLESEDMLAHEPHPSRSGHAKLMAHYVHVLDRLGWIPVPESDRPALPSGLSLDTSLPVDDASLARHRQEFVDEVLHERIDFTDLRRSDPRAFLGGIFPEQVGRDALSSAPWASVRSGFLLRTPARAAMDGATVRLRMALPDRPELYPLELRVRIDGGQPEHFRWPRAPGSAKGEVPQTLELALGPEAVGRSEAVEVRIDASRYYTTIHDRRMRSFRLLEATVTAGRAVGGEAAARSAEVGG